VPGWKIKNWKQFQHFKDRRPPWIKLYRGLLDDPQWFALSPTSSKVLVMLWLVASEDEGRLPDLEKLSFRFRMNEEKLSKSIQELRHWLIQDDIAVISERYHDDAPETETETETETEGEGERVTGTLSHPLVSIVPAKKGKRPITDDDRPTEKHQRLAETWKIDLGHEWGKFKNYCLAHDKRYSNFEAAFRNWLSGAYERKGATYASTSAVR
jgi:hypothetical protein